ncbi:MAG TPA: hypothetical protein VGQ93_01660, partial [Lysobacter sp.]|nr:hypothetical protein [Lysobacter sp.]
RKDSAYPLRADERCPATRQVSSQAPLHGDASAPLVALMATRGARGQYAREALARATVKGDSAREALVAALGENDQLWHFRLCKGNYVIPLGWTISEGVFKEMERQLVWTGEKQGGRYQLDKIAAAIFAPVATAMPPPLPAQPPKPPEQSAAQQVSAGAAAQAQ